MVLVGRDHVLDRRSPVTQGNHDLVGLAFLHASDSRLHHNANVTALLRIDVREMLPIDASFFMRFVEVQSWLSFILTGVD